jgi:DNA-binding CsgD family transcriptional regulator
MKPTAILDALGELVFVLDREQRVTAVHGSGFEAGRYRASEFLGKSIAEEWPADVAALQVHMNARALDGQVVVFDWEFPFPGSGHRMLTVLCPLYGESGQVTGILRISRELADEVRSVATHTLQSTLRSSSLDVAAKSAPGHRAGRRRQERTTAAKPRKVHLSEEVTSIIHNLSARERHVVGLLLESARTAQIARDLKISVHTVRQHVKHILRKAGVHSQQELLDLLRGK